MGVKLCSIYFLKFSIRLLIFLNILLLPISSSPNTKWKLYLAGKTTKGQVPSPWRRHRNPTEINGHLLRVAEGRVWLPGEYAAQCITRSQENWGLFPSLLPDVTQQGGKLGLSLPVSPPTILVCPCSLALLMHNVLASCCTCPNVPLRFHS